MAIAKYFDPNVKVRRLQSNVRRKETLQGLSASPFGKESQLIDVVLAEFFIQLTDNRVEEALESGELESLIAQYLNERTQPGATDQPHQAVKSFAPSFKTKKPLPLTKQNEIGAHGDEVPKATEPLSSAPPQAEQESVVTDQAIKDHFNSMFD